MRCVYIWDMVGNIGDNCRGCYIVNARNDCALNESVIAFWNCYLGFGFVRMLSEPHVCDVYK